VAELSPAAASIVQAFDDRYELLGGMEENWQEDCLAAALHAAVDQIITDHRLNSLNSERNAESRLFLIYVREQFRFIAAELEGIKYGTYRCELKGQ
jgi:hypothetical protein